MTVGFEPTPLSRTAESNLIRRLVDITSTCGALLRPLSFGGKFLIFHISFNFEMAHRQK